LTGAAAAARSLRVAACKASIVDKRGGDEAFKQRFDSFECLGGSGFVSGVTGDAAREDLAKLSDRCIVSVEVGQSRFPQAVWAQLVLVGPGPSR